MSLLRTLENTDLVRLNLHVLDELFAGEARQRVGVRLWDGTRWPDEQPRPVVLVLKSPSALRSMFLPGNELALAEAYLYDEFDIEGDIEQIFDLAEAIAEATNGWRKKVGVARDLLRLPSDGAGNGADRRVAPAPRRGPAELSGQQHSIERDPRGRPLSLRRLERLLLALPRQPDGLLVRLLRNRPTTTSSRRRTRKLDYICRKLRLQPGQRLLDIGCGWGGLVIMRPRSIRRRRAPASRSASPRPSWRTSASAGLASTGAAACWCETTARSTSRRAYDALVSVGMFEHVGEALLPALFRAGAQLC